MSEFLLVAERLLSEKQRAMRPKELVDLALERGLFSDRKSGKTPAQTMKSKLSVHIRSRGIASTFVRTGPNKFYLRRLVDRTGVYDAPPQQKPSSLEKVLVFPSSILKNRQQFQGITRRFEPLRKRILRPDTASHMERFAAESDNNHKQVLTYILLTRGKSVLAFKRGSYNRVEQFLRGSHCIGFGGHVASPDLTLFSQFDMGLMQSAVRELFEELDLPSKDRKRLESGKGLERIGVLNDDSSEVGRRHFAFLFRYEVSDDPAWEHPARGEKSITQLRWLSPASGKVPISDFEYWSQLCLREFFPWIAEAVPQFRIIRRAPLRPPHLLCVLGQVGSGKSEATRLITREFGYSEVNTGRVVAEILGIPPVPKTPREEFQKKAWNFIQATDGPAKLAGAILRKVRQVESGRVLIDGIRQRRTLESLQDAAGKSNVGVVYVHTSPDLAYKFYRSREAPGLSFIDFLRVRDARVEEDVHGLIAVADAVLYNWIGRSAYQKAIRGFMGSVTTE